MTWETIESAPKDWSEIIIFDGEKVCSAHWDMLENVWTDGVYDAYGEALVNKFNPTHWRPLPEPPTH